ncbi:MAG TPA: PHB depolymerase family esterase [Ktedonobacteraceae bacterium]
MRNSTCFLTFLLLLLLLASCTASPQAQQRPTPTPRPPVVNELVSTTGCRLSPVSSPGKTATLTIPVNPATANGNTTRSYSLYLPTSYDPAQPLPVLLIFHGADNFAADIELDTGFSHLAEAYHFIAVYPQGLPHGISGSPFWAIAGPNDPFAQGVDDLLFISNVLNDLQRTLCVDAHRIYATGFSNGGGMADYLACALARRIAAVAPISATLAPHPGGCHPGRPVPLLSFHGTADPELPYQGGPPSAIIPWPVAAVPTWLQDWATRNGCTRGPTVILRQPNVTGEQWTGCQGKATVIHYRIEHGNHALPPSIGGVSAMEVIWHFFQEYRLPS